MSANKRTTSREFDQLLEVLKSARMAGGAPFSGFIGKDANGPSNQLGFTSPARHTASDAADE